MGIVGAEQLLLDIHSRKTVLVDLPSLLEAGQVKLVGLKAPQAFTLVVVIAPPTDMEVEGVSMPNPTPPPPDTCPYWC